MTLPYIAVIALVLGAALILGLAQLLTTKAMLLSAIAALAALACGGCGVIFSSGASQLIVLAVAAFLVVAISLMPILELQFKQQRPEAVALLLLAGAGTIVLATGGDLLQLTIGMETLSLSSALLVVLAQGEAVTEAAFKYFLLAAVSLATLIYGLGLIYLSTGSIGFPATSAPHTVLLTAGIILMTVGFAFELALVPLHWGALDAYTTAAPTVAGAIMSLGKLGAVVAILRLAPSAGPGFLFVFAMVGLFTSVWGTTAAIRQREVRRLLAYSAIAHAGFLAMAIGSGPAGRQAAIFYVVAYAASALLVFTALSGLGPEPLRFGELPKRLGPQRTIAFCLGMMSLAGVPPLPGFWAKLAIFRPAWQVLGPVPTAIGIAAAVAAAVYYLAPIPDLWEGLRSPGAARFGANPGVVLAGLLVAIIAVVPGFLWAMTAL